MAESEKLRQARALLASGEARTKAEAARRVGVTKGWLTKDAECQRLTSGPTPIERALAMMAGGMTRNDAAKKVGVHPESITNHKRAKRRKEATA